MGAADAQVPAFELAYRRAKEAKEKKIGTRLSIPGQYQEDIDWTKYAAKTEEQPSKAPIQETQAEEAPQRKPTKRRAPAVTGLPMDKLKGYPIKLRNLVKKWIHNENVLNKVTDEAFVDFALKWYNGGKEGLLPFAPLTLGNMRTEKHVVHDDTDYALPPFLQDEFYRMGKADAQKDSDKQPTTKKDGGVNERTQDIDRGGDSEVSTDDTAERTADERGNRQAADTREETGEVLERLPAEDVQPAGGRKETVPVVKENRGEAGRGDSAVDEAGAERGPSLGSGERGNILDETGRADGRREDAGRAVTEVAPAAIEQAAVTEETPATVEQVTETEETPAAVEQADVTEETPAAIEQKAITEEAAAAVEQAAADEVSLNISGNNYIIPAEGLDLPSGEKARYRANVDAIRLALELEEADRLATPEEQAVLSRYVGWGGIPQAFDERRQVQETWGKEFEELKSLLSEKDYRDARASTTNAHYTVVPHILCKPF